MRGLFYNDVTALYAAEYVVLTNDDIHSAAEATGLVEREHR